MRIEHFFVIPSVLLALWVPCAHAQNVIKQFPVTGSLAEQQVLSLAERQNRNVFVDATDVPLITPAGQVPEYQKGFAPYSALIGLTQQFEWSFLDFTPDTYLFWQEPDEEKIALAIAQGQGRGKEEGIVSLEKLEVMLQDYVQKAGITRTKRVDKGWYRKGAGPLGAPAGPLQEANHTTDVYKFGFKELPVDLRTQLAALIVEQTVGNEEDYLRIWLQDAPWSQARIFYVPAPRNLTGARQTLFAVSYIQTAQGTRRVFLNLRQGGGSSQPFASAPYQSADVAANVLLARKVDTALLDGKLQVLPLTPEETKVPVAVGATPIFIPNPLLPAGEANRAFDANIFAPQLIPDERLEKPLTLREIRLPLVELIRRVGQVTGVRLTIGPNVRGETPLVSLTVKELAAREVMLAVARLYGLTWVKEADASYLLKNAQLSPLDKELVRVGSEWFRIREASYPFLTQDYAEFDALAREIVDEADTKIMTYPGVPIASLSPETQQKIRLRPQSNILRRITLAQIEPFKYLQPDLFFEYRPGNDTQDANLRISRNQTEMNVALPLLPLKQDIDEGEVHDRQH